MIRRDMPAVMRCERASFEYAWTEDDFLRCLRQRNCIGMVAEVDDQVAGYMIYELHKTRLNVLNFAVHPAHRREGIGDMLMAKLEYKLASHHREKITVAVRERNLAAQMFFKSNGFQATKLLHNYYEDSGEDAYHMEYRNPNIEDGINKFSHVNRISGYFDEESPSR